MKYIMKNNNIQLYCQFWNIVFYIKGGTQAKGIWKHDYEANIWTKKDENGDWRGPHNEELQSLYRSPNLVRVI